jgi:hypothetical protein
MLFNFATCFSSFVIDIVHSKDFEFAYLPTVFVVDKMKKKKNAKTAAQLSTHSFKFFGCITCGNNTAMLYARSVCGEVVGDRNRKSG